MGLLGRWLRKAPTTVEATAAASPPAMVWHDGTTAPIADWQAIGRALPADADDRARHAFWSGAAREWLRVLGEHFDPAYAIEASDHFLMLSALSPRTAGLTLGVCERMRHRILRMLPKTARASGHGPHVVVVFDDDESYYRYIDNYYAEGGEYAQSSGMFLSHGYGHFVFRADDVANMEPVVAHELTHCLLMHLPLPAWLNEGIAVNVERRLAPRYVDPRNASMELRERTAKRRTYWNASTIQAFWSGKSYLSAGEGSALSYDLGEDLAAMLSREPEGFSAFANAANVEDGGAAAARTCFGVSLGHIAEAVLGPGEWEPEPLAWTDGTERGQFAPRT